MYRRTKAHIALCIISNLLLPVLSGATFFLRLQDEPVEVRKLCLQESELSSAGFKHML